VSGGPSGFELRIPGHRIKWVYVTTPFWPEAEGTLKNNEDTYCVKTPGTVTIDRDYDDLMVGCKNEEHSRATITESSSTKGMAFGRVNFFGLRKTGFQGQAETEDRTSKTPVLACLAERCLRRPRSRKHAVLGFRAPVHSVSAVELGIFYALPG
jgi:hypothetical protein